uniref:Uncharacterized protein n=1 Tax=Helianthus annuus TaxID=4232 RepID=A0A251VLM8_HELAN
MDQAFKITWFCGGGGAIAVILLWCVFHPPSVTCRRDGGLWSLVLGVSNDG